MVIRLLNIASVGKFGFKFNAGKTVLFLCMVSLFAPLMVRGEESFGMPHFRNIANKWLDCNCVSPAWCQGLDINTDGTVNIDDLVIFSADWPEVTSLAGMTMINVNEPGFTGQMSKYETTNAQYAAYLNLAMSKGLIIVHSNDLVYSSTDTNYERPYCYVYGVNNSHSQIIYSGGVFCVRNRDGYDMSDHPVVLVTWHGATAFCNYYGYRLPTNSEWTAVADYDGSYYYGCGVMPDPSMATYGGSNPLSLSETPYTTPVTYYCSYGYGFNDMTGNVYELTNSISEYINGQPLYITKGGDWMRNYYFASVSSTCSTGCGTASEGLGFRVCR